MSEEIDAVEAQVCADIEERGFHLGIVPADAGTPGWAFSVGLVERFDHPELVAFAPDAKFAGGLIENLAMRVLRGRRFDGPEPAHPGILGEHGVTFRAVDRKWIPVFLGNVAWHYRDPAGPPGPTAPANPGSVTVLQCFWPDRAGRFPWDPGFDPEWRDDQPQLHLAETHRALSERLIATLYGEGAL